MTDFFKRMSEMALGVAATVQPLVASRYAPGPRLVTTELPQASSLDSETEEQTRSLRQQPDAIAATESEPDRLDNTIPQSSRLPQQREHNVRAETKPLRATVAQPQSSRSETADDSVQKTPARASVDPGHPDHGEKIRQTQASNRIVEFEADRVISPPPRVQSVNRMQVGPHAHDSFPPVRSDSFVVDESVPVAQSRLRSGPGSALSEMEQESLAPKGIQQTSPVLSPLPQARKPDEQNHSPEKIERRKEPVQNPMQELARVQPRPQALDQEVREGDRRADPEPTVVRVTIGRIEVRAIMPAVPPVEVPAKPAPKLSLDEYLRKQSGRRP